MPDVIITQEQLAEMSGYQRPSEIAQWLERQGVRPLLGKRGRVSTTLEALVRAQCGESAPRRVEFV